MKYRFKLLNCSVIRTYSSGSNWHNVSLTLSAMGGAGHSIAWGGAILTPQRAVPPKLSAQHCLTLSAMGGAGPSGAWEGQFDPHI